ncbi:MAG: amidohydrolase, partial [Calditrichaeota bacterium]|nr:amidohydrolase [Calditrichota bacterium]
MKLTTILTLIVFLTACSPEPADLVLHSGKIVTVTDAVPQAEAVAVKGDKILLLGSDAEVKSFIGPNTKVIDLQGKLVIPGFIEGHGHYVGLGRSLQRLRLMNTKNWSEIEQIVAQAVAKAKPGEWIMGRGWHQEKWDQAPANNVNGWPIHDAISKMTPDNPVILSHASGHSLFANAKAMELAGITRSTKPLEGGDIIKDKRGNPIGIFVDNDMRRFGDLYDAYRAQMTDEEKSADSLAVVKLAAEEALKKGVTSFQDAGEELEWISTLKKFAEQGELDVRLWVMVLDSLKDLKEKLPSTKIYRIGNNMMTLGGIKKQMDGALGSRSAWMLEPYSDLPSESGLNLVTMDEMRELEQLAYDNNLQLCTHAIGDRANREVLNLYEEFFKKHPDKKDWRWRIEHAQHLHPDDIPRFAELGVITQGESIVGEG